MRSLAGFRPGNSAQILLVDDEIHTLLGFNTLLKSAGLRSVTTIDDSRNVIPFLEKQAEKNAQVALIVLDLSMPFVPGEELLVDIKQRFPDIPVIIMTATNTIDSAVQCMKNGAMDYLVKPVESNRFISSIRQALEVHRLQQEVLYLKKSLLADQLSNPAAFSHIITQDKQMLSIFKYVEAIAPSSHPVLITGETGVGKELIGKAIHKCGKPGKEFVAVNVAGLDDTMFSDTLFGHKKGAYTGADAVREGLIARAAGGTAFLDEIGDMSPQSQVKLLRLIQENEFYPLGSDIPKKSDAHIITATNRDLKLAIDNGHFRKDLYFRLCSHHIYIPPLRNRKEDIPVLVDHFLDKAAKALDKKAPIPPPDLFSLLSSYDFPGNVRELESMVINAVSLHKTGMLSLESFRQMMKSEAFTKNGKVELEKPLPGHPGIEQFFGKFPSIKQMEDYLIGEALKRANGNQGTAAAFLGITRQALNKRLNRQVSS